ncbi:MAG: galactokinase [Oscillospiraceae bacterium]|nr:galactokinase [Oscillospiraceae bacterium]
MKFDALIHSLEHGELDPSLSKIYGSEKNVKNQISRYKEFLVDFENNFGKNRDISIFSAPGRTEIGGNHTDHQLGRVFAASVNLDIIGAASKNTDNLIRIKSKGFNLDTIDISSEKITPVAKERESAAALIRGVAAWFVNNGYKIGGFDMYTVSDVLKGSGLSSSAAFESVIGTALNYLFNDGAVTAPEIAKAGQYAENVFFGKPSGLMDQMACSVGGFVLIDFEDVRSPIIKSVDFDFIAANHALCIVNTGGSHANLTDEYASVPREMKNIASFFGRDALRQVDEDEFMSNIPQLRKLYGDRAVLRAMHFYYDNDTPLFMASALSENNFDAFLGFVNESGHSSFECLQNLYCSSDPSSQNLPLALAISRKVLAGRGACRVHGGGFAGTIQAYVPLDLLDNYKAALDAVFGKGACMQLSVRPVGAVKIV